MHLSCGEDHRKDAGSIDGITQLRAQGWADHGEPLWWADQELVSEHPTLQIVSQSLLAVHEVLLREFKGFEKRVRVMARDGARAKLLMTTTGVGAVVSLTCASAIDDPGQFKKSKQVGAHFELTQRHYQSGEIDVAGRISKIGDKGVRTALYQSAHIILTKPVKGSALKSWATAPRRGVGI